MECNEVKENNDELKAPAQCALLLVRTDYALLLNIKRKATSRDRPKPIPSVTGSLKANISIGTFIIAVLVQGT